jgi:hypothetical protein
MTTQAQFLSTTCIDAKLARAVIRQLGGWSQFKEFAVDICNHGIDSGFSGFTYYSDTVPFFTRNRRAIIDLAKEQAADFGQGVLEMIAGFNCLNGDYTSDEIGETLFGRNPDTQIANALAWYAGEEVCRSFVDMSE